MNVTHNIKKKKMRRGGDARTRGLIGDYGFMRGK